MKKLLLPLFILTTLPAFAVKINPDTQIQWNAIVIVAALDDTDFEMTFGSSERYLLLQDLLERDTFSAEEAVRLCRNRCKKYEETWNISEKDRNEFYATCEKFGNALIEHNNRGTNSLQGEDGWYNAYGRIYSKDRLFYVDNIPDTTPANHTHKTGDYSETHSSTCNVAVFENITNKKIATCNNSFGEDGTSTIHFKVIASEYNGYEFELTCFQSLLNTEEDETCKLDIVNAPQNEYTYFYSQYYKPCIDSLNQVDFEAVARLKNDNIIREYYRNRLNQIYEARNYKSDRITPTSFDLYDEMQSKYNKYCGGLENWSHIEYDVKYFDIHHYINNGLNKVRNQIETLFRDTKRYKNVQVKDLNEVWSKVVDDIDNVYVEYDMLDCTGKCNPTGQDYVTCTLGDLTATFEFADICEGQYKEKLKNIFK